MILNMRSFLTCLFFVSFSKQILADQHIKSTDFKSLIPTYSNDQMVDLYSAINFTEIKTFISSQAVRDLEFDTLKRSLDRTVLASSSVEFGRLLLPIDDLESLSKRENIINSLLADEKLFSELDRAVREFRKYEHAFIHLLDMKHWADVSLGSGLFGLLFRGGIVSLAVWADLRYANMDRVALRQGPDEGRGFWRRAGLMSAILKQGLSAFVAGGVFAYDAGAIRTSFAKVEKYVQNFSLGMQKLEAVNRAVSGDSELRRGFVQFEAMKKEMNSDKDIAWIYRNIEDRWDPDGPSLRNQIAVSDVYHAVKENRELLASALWWVARIDAYLSVVRWVKEKRRDKEPVCFAKIQTESKKSQFKMHEITSPTIENAVSNNFDIAEHVVLTGPHALGKTTSIRTIAYGHIMAQSIRVVAAKSMEIRLLNHFGTYFNVTDSNVESSFQAEFRNMDQLLQVATRGSDQMVSLFLIDEPFAKTISLVGNRLIERFLIDVSKVPNITMLLSTHLKMPATFAKVNPGFKNMQPLVQEDENGFVPTYKMIDGAAEWWFDNAHEKTIRYIDWLVNKKSGSRNQWNISLASDPGNTEQQ